MSANGQKPIFIKDKTLQKQGLEVVLGSFCIALSRGGEAHAIWHAIFGPNL
jgi:hypothetical protein